MTLHLFGECAHLIKKKIQFKFTYFEVPGNILRIPEIHNSINIKYAIY